MKKIIITIVSLVLTLAVLIPLSVKASTQSSKVYTVKFIDENNVTEITLSSGNKALATSLLIDSKEVAEGATVTPTDKVPERAEFEFKCWSKDRVNAFDFTTPITSNLNLYSLYERKPLEQGEVYVEPTFTFTEKKSDSIDLIEVTRVLNMPVSGGQVSLTTAGIKKLTDKDITNDFLTYTINTNASIKGIVFEDNVLKITVTKASVDTLVSITVANMTSSLKDQNNNYESKAVKYENNYDFASNGIVLAGSSSIENFKTSTEDLAPLTTLNCGIGGTTVDQWIDKFAKRLIYQYSPRAVVLYCGINNIINAKNSGTYTGNKLIELFDQIHEYLPDAQIYYIPMNLVPGYMQYKAQIEEGNRIAIAYGQDKDYMNYIDAGTLLLKENGEPNVSYFLTDGLHMSLCGYVIWGGEMKRVIIEREKEIYNG